MHIYCIITSDALVGNLFFPLHRSLHSPYITPNKVIYCLYLHLSLNHFIIYYEKLLYFFKYVNHHHHQKVTQMEQSISFCFRFLVTHAQRNVNNAVRHKAWASGLSVGERDLQFDTDKPYLPKHAHRSQWQEKIKKEKKKDFLWTYFVSKYARSSKI